MSIKELTDLLKEIIVWLLTGGGAGAVAYAAIEAVPFLKALGADYKRYVSLALTGVLADAVGALTIWFGWTPVPLNAQEWVMTMLGYAALAIITAQTIHGARDLRPKRIAKENNA